MSDFPIKKKPNRGILNPPLNFGFFGICFEQKIYKNKPLCGERFFFSVEVAIIEKNIQYLEDSKIYLHIIEMDTFKRDLLYNKKISHEQV